MRVLKSMGCKGLSVMLSCGTQSFDRAVTLRKLEYGGEARSLRR